MKQSPGILTRAPILVAIPARLKLAIRFAPAALLVTACGSDPSSPPPPPDAADTVAFVKDSSIYLVGTEEGAVPLRIDSGFVQPSWSPDGSTLAMVATGPKDPIVETIPQSLYLADADGGNVRLLAGFGDQIDSPPLWTPDGSTVVFVRSFQGFGPDHAHMAKISATGGTETPVGPFSLGPDPSLSFDGSLLAASNGITGGFDVVDLATGTTLLNFKGSSPQFSPVTTVLAYSETGVGHIRLTQPDGSGDRDLGVTGSPQSWTPDGQRLVFRSVDGVYTMNGDGTDLVRIGPLNMVIGDITWSPDSKHIAYVASSTIGPSTLYVAAADDSDRRPLVTEDGLCCAAWRPRPE
jgi:Tol biopolymer transport system component